jgi:hypothetical protein
MPNPIENPLTVQEEYGHHQRFDGVGGNLAAGTTWGSSFLENMFGHRSGVGNTTPWATALTRPLPGYYQDSNTQGSGATFAAAALTDASKAWGVGDQNSGGTVTYAATTITDTARSGAGAWVVGNTAQYAGTIVRTATGKLGIIASVAANVATLTAAGWSGGTPAAGEQYNFFPLGLVGRTIFAVGTGGALTTGVIIYHIATVATITAWSNGTPSAGAAYIIGPNLTAGVLNAADLDGFGRAKIADNWQFTLRGLFNPNNL